MLFTLRRFPDFLPINSRQIRLSLGATNLATGNLEFFDNQRQTIGPEHVLASGSLPPGFPATAVGGKLYWDGGCVSNTKFGPDIMRFLGTTKPDPFALKCNRPIRPHPDRPSRVKIGVIGSSPSGSSVDCGRRAR
jgi:hypothetical protein